LFLAGSFCCAGKLILGSCEVLSKGFSDCLIDPQVKSFALQVKCFESVAVVWIAAVGGSGVRILLL
jgi:hypothetical protein